MMLTHLCAALADFDNLIVHAKSKELRQTVSCRQYGYLHAHKSAIVFDRHKLRLLHDRRTFLPDPNAACVVTGKLIRLKQHKRRWDRAKRYAGHARGEVCAGRTQWPTCGREG